MIAIVDRVILPSLASLPLFWPFLAIAVALLAGAALLPLRVNFFGIGGEGQMYAGGLGSAIAGLYLVGLPGWLHLPLAVACGALGVAAWGAMHSLRLARLGFPASSGSRAFPCSLSSGLPTPL